MVLYGNKHNEDSKEDIGITNINTVTKILLQ
jgi:hypothetical protein